ncbi:MAG: NUDIX domain-containing protein [Armatimonadetes bacterium]|nr:NUDIX domain-containing protein [Armatimonadota bacterium]
MAGLPANWVGRVYRGGGRLMPPNTLEKVTAFVTRDAKQGRELLLFRHPSGGIQLPAGTVEENETAANAALREAQEETGLTALTIAAYLGAEPQALPDGGRVILRRTVLFQHAAPDAPETIPNFVFHGLRRGLYVRQTGEAEQGRVPVVYEEFDTISDGGAAIPARAAHGWINANDVTDTLTRHFYHLVSADPTPDTWTQNAEEWEHAFDLFWSPVSVAASLLIPSQAAWLGDYAEQLLAE